MATRKHSKEKKKFRIGSVSVYKHRSPWWLYYRENGAVRRRRASQDLEEARVMAAEVNAQLAGNRSTLFSFQPTRADAPCLEFGLDVADGVGELGEDCQCEPYAETALHLPNRRSKDFDFDSFGYWDRMTSISFGESFPLLLK